MIRSELLARASLLTVATAIALAATPALAQSVDQTNAEATAEPVGSEATSAEDEAAQDSATGEIVVTARRTEERLQRVPAAVSAFNERALERIQAQDVTGLQGAVPNLNIVQGRGSSNSTNIFIRGIGQPDALQTFDPAVGLYVDGVYFSRIRGTQLELLDLERVEVLRGPQGTLYGKNTIGGALSLVTRKPGQDRHGNASLTYGNYDRFEARAGVSGPLSETISAGIAVLHSVRDGFVEDEVLDREYNDKNTQAIRGTLAFTPSAAFRVDLAADYSEDDTALTVGQPLNSITYLVSGAVHLPLPTNPDDYDFTARTTPSLPNSSELRHWGVSMNAALDLNDAVTLRSISAYRDLNTDDYVDIDATQLEVGDVFVGVDQNQVSQEFQVNYNSGPLQAVAGLFYLREHVKSHQEAYGDDLIDLRPFVGIFPPAVLGPVFPTSLRTVDDDLKTTSYAAYANASYQILPALRVSAGIRYTKEKRDYERTTTLFSNSPLLVALNPTFPFERNDSWTNVSPMASIDYQINADTMVYARVARGFKSGGFNGRANSAADATTYDPETVTSYEAGLKTTIANQLRFNLTGFYNDYKDFQARVAGTDESGTVPVATLGVLNAGQLKIKGAELEVAWTPVRGLLLDSQIGYLDAEYGEFFDDRFPGDSRAFQTPPFAPDWTLRLGAQYEADIGASGRITIGGQSRYRSEMALSVDNTVVIGTVGTTTRIDGLFSDPYWVHDARLVWEDAERMLNVGFYVQNLTETVYKTEGQDFSSIGSIRTVYYGAPRTWYVKAGVRF